MPPRTLASLAQSLSVATDVEGALMALADSLAELDRFAQLAFVRFDARRALMRDRLLVAARNVERVTLDTTIDHLPDRERVAIAAGGQFVDFGDSSDENARLFALKPPEEGGILAVRGLHFDGALCSLLVLYEPRKIFGTRTSERFAPAAALFDISHARFLEEDARQEAVTTLEDFTQRLHGEYEKKLATLESKLLRMSGEFAAGAHPGRVVELERELAHATEDARRTKKRAEAVEATVSTAVEQLEKAHIELHRRNEQLRQRTRTLYLIDRVLTLDNMTDDPQTARRRAPRARRRRHALAALLTAAARARGGIPVHRRGQGRRPQHHRRVAHQDRPRRRRKGRRQPRADHRPGRGRGEGPPAAPRRILHERLVHQLPARVSRRAGGRRQPHQPC